MVEVFLVLMLPVLLIPQFAAGFLARQLGRSYWLWFAISFVLPLFSLVILLMIGESAVAEETSGKTDTSTMYDHQS